MCEKYFTLSIDIGAAGGINEKWYTLGKQLHVIGFEPNEDECIKLGTSSLELEIQIEYLNVALDKIPGHIELCILQESADTSKYIPNYVFLNRFPKAERFKLVSRKMVESDTLDSVVTTMSGGKADFLKIDTQGSELDILIGADRTLSELVSGVEVEVCFSELYKGAPLFADIDHYLRERGFALYDLSRSYWKRIETTYRGAGQLIFGDALYLKDYIALRSVPDNLGAPIVAAIINKKYDYALEYAKYLVDIGRLDKSKGYLLLKAIKAYATPFLRIPYFKGRGRLGKMFEKCSDYLKCTSGNRTDSWV